MDDFCNTMLDMYRNGGLIPRGPSGGNYTYVMIGDPAVSFFATAYNKGIRNYDADLAYEGLRKNAFPGGIVTMPVTNIVRMLIQVEWNIILKWDMCLMDVRMW